MLRCPHCGRRISEAAPICSTHGPAPAIAAAGGSAPLTYDAREALAERGYRVTGLLGRGGFGAVYAATRAGDHARVAIKLAAREPERLQREEEALRAIGAPHVPSVLGGGLLEVGRYLAMELIEAPSLAAHMVDLAGPAALDKFSALAHAILTPLEAVHAAGFLHSDLKPEHLFIGPAGGARLIDFGLARRFDPRLQLVPADDVGTAEYMSPEQCDRLLCDRSTDIYSIGIMFYELLNGAPPFWGPAADVREAHRSQRPASLARTVSCPPQLDQLIRRCLAKDRALRFSDIPSLRHALTQALSSRMSGPRPSGESVLPKLTAAAAPTTEKRAMGLVFFESNQGVAKAQANVAASGGQLVHTQNASFVAAFGHEAGANPARVALRAAERLLESDVAERVLVDVATVSVHTRPNGSRRIFSTLLTKADRYPTVHDPRGIMFTSAASEVLPELEFQPLHDTPGRFVVVAANSSSEELPPLVGRDEILSALLTSAQHAHERADPTLVTVVGPHGYGRTHLAAAVAHELSRSQRACEVISLSAQEGAMSPVLPKLLRLLLQLPKTPPEALKALLLSRLGEAGEATWAGVAHALEWIDAEHPEVRRLAAAPGTLRLIAARTAGEALRRMAAEKPVALLLDDAHLADEATLDALQYATMKEPPARIWVCVLAPQGFASIRPSWYSRTGVAENIVLPALAPQHAVELARRLLLPAQYTSEAVLLKLAERTQGVPHLLVELVRGLKRDGFVRKSERGSGYYLATDELDKLSDLPILQWNAMREIEALPPQLAGHARLASVLGSSFSVAEIDALEAQLERDDVLDIQLDPSVGVSRLVDSGILVRHPSGLIDFRHAMLRDMIYRLVPEDQRARIHRAAFDAYSTLAMPETQRLQRVAMHAARCGEREIAATAYLELARHFLRAQAYLEAEAAYGGALDNLSETDLRSLEAARGRGLMRSRLGRQDEALVDLRRARELAQAHAAREQELEIMLDEAAVLDWLRESSSAITLVRAVESAELTLSPLLRARVAMGIARRHFALSEVEATIRLGNEAVQLAAALGDDGYETCIIAQLMVAPCYAMLGKLEEAEHMFEQLLAETESRGDLRHVAATLGNRVFLWYGLRKVDRLFADLSRTTKLARELGEASVEYVSVYNLAEIEFALGRLDDAREHAARMLHLAKQQFGEIHREVSSGELLLARIALYDDDLAAAARLTKNITERIELGRAQANPEVELEPAARLLLHMVELSTSAAPLSAWQALLDQSRSVELQAIETVELLERAALTAAQLGDWAVGHSIYRQAIEFLAVKPTLSLERVRHRLDLIFAEPA